MMMKKFYPMKSDVREKKDAYLLDIDLPGCKKEDIKVYVENGYLVVTASMNVDKSKGSGKFLRKECYSGEYQRSFYLGIQIPEDEIKASYKHGVLRLSIPKESMNKKPEDGRIMIG